MRLGRCLAALAAVGRQFQSTDCAGLIPFQRATAPWVPDERRIAPRRLRSQVLARGCTLIQHAMQARFVERALSFGHHDRRTALPRECGSTLGGQKQPFEIGCGMTHHRLHVSQCVAAAALFRAIPRFGNGTSAGKEPMPRLQLGCAHFMTRPMPAAAMRTRRAVSAGRCSGNRNTAGRWRFLAHSRRRSAHGKTRNGHSGEASGR